MYTVLTRLLLLDDAAVGVVLAQQVAALLFAVTLAIGARLIPGQDWSLGSLDAKPITGPAKPGILGVLQAEHNLVVRMKSVPNATNLRYVIDSMRLLARHLVPFAARADTYLQLQRQFRPIGGLLGSGGPAASEEANAVSRLRALPADTIVEPRVLGGFQLLFDRLDRRIADVIEDGIDEGALFQRVRLPRLVEGRGDLVAPVRERFTPVDRTTNRELIDTVRDRLQPRTSPLPTTPGPTRAELSLALIHRPVSRPGPTIL